MKNETKSIVTIIEEVCEDVCENYCEYRNTIDDYGECDVQKYVNEGKSNVEIAYLLDISVATVIAGVKAYGLKGMRKRGRPKKELIH